MQRGAAGGGQDTPQTIMSRLLGTILLLLVLPGEWWGDTGTSSLGWAWAWGKCFPCGKART